MSKRKAKRQFDRWNRYFTHYEPWHMPTPGMLRAYDACVRADAASQRRGWAELQRRARSGGRDAD